MHEGITTIDKTMAVTVVGGMVGYTNFVSVPVEESCDCGYYAAPAG